MNRGGDGRFGAGKDSVASIDRFHFETGNRRRIRVLRSVDFGFRHVAFPTVQGYGFSVISEMLLRYYTRHLIQTVRSTHCDRRRTIDA